MLSRPCLLSSDHSGRHLFIEATGAVVMWDLSGWDSYGPEHPVAVVVRELHLPSTKGLVISLNDVDRLGAVLNRLKAFHEEWDGREDDPEDMLTEAPEMVAEIVQKMEEVMKRLELQR